MSEWLSGIFGTDGYLPHGLCLAWEPGLIWLQVVSDGLIAASYYSIPAALIYFALKRTDLPFPIIFGLFATFIVACGTTHLLGAVVLWEPLYRLDGEVKAATALVSVPTAATLWYLLPKALALPSPAQLEIANRELAREIERRRDVEQELRELNAELDERVRARTAQLQSILDTVPDAMIIIDERGAIDSFSSAAERIFGYRSNEVRGRNVSMLMPSPDRERHDKYLDRYLKTREPHIIGIGRVVSAERKDGTTMPMELAVGEVSLKGRRHFVGFLRDLTERQERERRLHEVQSELLHVSRVSSLGEMASALAHELNQPLTAVTNYVRGAKRIAEGISDEREELLREALDKAGDQALRAGQVVQRLRQFMSHGETEKRVESIRRIIDEAAALALMVAKEQSVQVTYELDPAADGVLVDKIQIQQILLNLLRNAIEAMQSCERRALAVSTTPTVDGMIAVTVADTGPGIAPDVMSRLFQPFVTTKVNGMGVGLSISRTIVESHGGKITCEARPNGGTVFCFTLPAADVTEIADFQRAE